MPSSRFHSGMMLFRAVAAAGALSAASALAAGPSIFFDKERDLPSLTPACQARIGKASETEYKRWERELGHEIFFHYHHYCFGVFEFNKAMLGIGLDRPARMALYRDSITQFDYVLARWPKDHPLYFESSMYRDMAAAKVKRK